MTTTDVAVSAPPNAWRTGAVDAVPFVVAVVPFGLAIGTAGASAGFSLAATMFGGAALLAGASQLAATDVLADGGGLVSLLIVVGLLNVRFVLYGTGVSTWFAGRSRRRRLLLAAPIIDQSFLLCQQRFADVEDETWRERYYRRRPRRWRRRISPARRSGTRPGLPCRPGSASISPLPSSSRGCSAPRWPIDTKRRRPSSPSCCFSAPPRWSVPRVCRSR